MPRQGLRFSVRSLLIAIAVVGILLGGGLVECRRRSVYWERLYYHLQQLEGCPPKSAGEDFFFQLSQDHQAHLVKLWVYHARMSQKYETALSIPWFFVSADPPEP